MNGRQRSETNGADAREPSTAARRRVIDDRWNEEMTRLLREAAEVRGERDRARASQDERLARHEAAALLSLIRGRGRPTVKHHIMRPIAKPPEPGESLR